MFERLVAQQRLPLEERLVAARVVAAVWLVAGGGRAANERHEHGARPARVSRQVLRT